jgi:Rrf2 family transcriptional regulator, cysteine metabolism repressor
MNVSTKTRYGFRFLINLALKYQNGVVQIKEVAEKEVISIKYLEYIAAILKSSGLIKVERGSKGGYYLSRSPETITSREIMEALEGSIQILDCNENGEPCKMKDNCAMPGFWGDLSNHITSFLDNVTLEDLKKQLKNKDTQSMYFI